DGKMGKTHLLTLVLPALAKRDYQARWALLDLNYPLATVPDILSQACVQLGDHSFHEYYAAEQAWMNRLEGDVNGLAAHLSRILTLQFLKGLNQLTDCPLLLLFDSLEKASEEMQRWLMKTLLVSLSRLKHIRVVLAGRSLPEPDGSYHTLCLSHQLQ